MSFSTKNFTPWHWRKLRILRDWLAAQPPRERILRDEARALAFDEGRQEMLASMLEQFEAEILAAARNQARAVTVTFKQVAGRNWRGRGVAHREILARALFEYARKQKLEIECVDDEWLESFRVRW